LGLIDDEAYQRFKSDAYYIPFYKEMENGDVEGGIWTVGMVQGLINDIPSCAELVHRIVLDAEKIIQTRLAAFAH
jgi:nitronate monooxygenase